MALSKSGAIAIAVLAVVFVAGFIAFQFLFTPVVKTIVVDMREFEYIIDGRANPTIRVKLGETVRLVLKNLGGIKHEFMIVEDLEEAIEHIKEGSHPHGLFIEHFDVEPEEEITIVFTPDKPGEYFYVCLEEEPVLHAEEGMWGKLVVEA